jgi:hypothetical protein
LQLLTERCAGSCHSLSNNYGLILTSDVERDPVPSEERK